MNNIDFEKKLAENGFTYKEISVLKEHAEKDGYQYSWLLFQLRRRFFISCGLLILLCLIWIHTAFTGTHEDIVSYSIMMVVGTLTFYVFTPMKAGFKAYRFLKKHHF